MSLTDRKRTELTFPSQFMLSMLMSAIDDPRDEEFQLCCALLIEHTRAQVAGVSEAKGASIMRRSQAAYVSAVKPYAGLGKSVGKFGLIVYYWIKDMIEAGYWDFPDESPFMRAMAMILPLLEPAANEPRLDASAYKHSGQLLRRLQQLGYFAEVILTESTP